MVHVIHTDITETLMNNDDNRISIFYVSTGAYVFVCVCLFSARRPLTENFRKGVGYKLCDSIINDQSFEQRARHTMRAQKGIT